MSFLRFATLFAAIVSLLDFALAVADLVNDFASSSSFLHRASVLQMMQFFTWPLFALALTMFFTALFVRQKG